MDSTRSQAQANSIDLTNSVQFSHSDAAAVTQKVSNHSADPVADGPQRDLEAKMAPKETVRVNRVAAAPWRETMPARVESPAIQWPYGLRYPSR